MNRVRYTMNAFVIMVGISVRALHEEAEHIAKEIGIVQVNFIFMYFTSTVAYCLPAARRGHPGPGQPVVRRDQSAPQARIRSSGHSSLARTAAHRCAPGPRHRRGPATARRARPGRPA